MEIGTGSNFSLADVQYNTFGFGALHHFNDNLKLTLFYDLVKNESTSLPGATADISDNVFTCRCSSGSNKGGNNSLMLR
jgi:hypothetical protein